MIKCSLEKSADDPLRWECRYCERYVITRHERSHVVGELACNRKLGLGDYVAKGLGTFGVKKKQGCGCDKRQEKLNRIGERVVKALRRESRN